MQPLEMPLGQPMKAEQRKVGSEFPKRIGRNRGHGIDVALVVVERIDPLRLRQRLRQRLQYLPHLLLDGQRGRLRVLGIERKDDQTFDFRQRKPLQGFANTGIPVPHPQRNVQIVTGPKFDAKRGGKRARMEQQRRTVIRPYFPIEGRRYLRPFRNDHPVDQGPPQKFRNVDDFRIHQEFLQVRTHGFGSGGFRAAQVDQEQPDLRRRFGRVSQ